MYGFIPPLSVLAPHVSNLAVYAQVCRLLCVLYIPLFGLVQARPRFRSSVWISSVASIFKILCTSVVAGATRTYVRMLNILRSKLLVLERKVKVQLSTDRKRNYDWLTVCERM